MKRTLLMVLVCFYAGVSFGCSSISISSNTAPGVNREEYVTYRLAGPEMSRTSSGLSLAYDNKNYLYGSLLRRILDKALQQNGFVPAAQDEPSLLISFSEEPTYPDLLSPEEKRFKHGTRGSTFPEATPFGRRIEQRSLIVEARDTKTRATIWQTRADHLPSDYYKSEKRLYDIVLDMIEAVK